MQFRSARDKSEREFTKHASTRGLTFSRDAQRVWGRYPTRAPPRVAADRSPSNANDAHPADVKCGHYIVFGRDETDFALLRGPFLLPRSQVRHGEFHARLRASTTNQPGRL